MNYIYNTVNLIKTHNAKYKLLFVFVISIQCAIIFWFGINKPNLFIDEWWSYNLANGCPSIIKGIDDGWLAKVLDSNFWNSIVTVRWSDSFNFYWVWENQARDVHPPLYYLILHMLCGGWDGKFSMLPGLLINIVFFVLTQVVIYRLVSYFCNGKNGYSILAVFIFGISLGGLSLTLSIRMYMMLTFFVALMTYVNILIVNGEKRCISLLILHVCGFLTQYFYIIYAVFAAVPVMIKFIADRNNKDLIKYILVSCVAMTACYIIFPSFVTHIFGQGDRGAETFSNLTSFDFLIRLRIFLAGFARNVGIIFVSLFTLISIVILLREHFDKTRFIRYVRFNRASFYSFLVLLSSLFFSFCVIAKVAPPAHRYLFPMMPGICTLVVMSLFYLLDKSVWSRGKKTAVVALFLVGFLAETLLMFRVHWYWTDHEQIKNIFVKNPDTVFVAVIKNVRHPLIASQGYNLQMAKYSYIVTENDLSALSRVLEKLRSNLILWVQGYYPSDVDGITREAKSILGVNRCQVLFDDFGKVEYCQR